MKKAQRIIIKVGSSSLVLPSGKINELFFDKLIKTISSLMNENKEVILVTSGAIAVGMGKLGLPKKPKNMALKQACAALGQATLMNEYEKIASKYNLMCAQILVNHDDFESRSRMINLSNTFEELFNNKILPIVNENDALNVEEIKVGDNDTLSALLVPMINCDLLVLVSDIDGLYDKNPKQFEDAKKIDYVYKIDKTIDMMVGDITSNVGTGGMETKIKAARICTFAGGNMAIICNDDIEKIIDLINGEKVGTLFISDKTLHSKEHWIVYNTYAKGILIVDEGAKEALLQRKSLLPKGILNVSGIFKEFSVVLITDKNNNKIAKGITNYSSNDINNVIGKHSSVAKEILKSEKEEIIHANSLVLLDGDNYGKIK